MLARFAIGVVVVAAAAFLVVLASVVKTHTCDVGCSPSTFAWAQGLAVAGALVGCAALYVSRPETERGEAPRAVSLGAGLTACVVLYLVAFGLLLAHG